MMLESDRVKAPCCSVLKEGPGWKEGIENLGGTGLCMEDGRGVGKEVK